MIDLQGLSYPIVIALMTVVVGFFTLKETHHIRIWDEVEGGQPGTTERPAVVDGTDSGARARGQA